VGGRLFALVGGMALAACVIVVAHLASNRAQARRSAAQRVEVDVHTVHGRMGQLLRTGDADHAARARARLRDAEAALASLGPSARRTLKPLFRAYRACIAELVAAFDARGRGPDEGAEGRLREAIHEVEALVREAGREDLLLSMLTARRGEKDYIMRGEPKYALRVHDAIRALLNGLDAGGASLTPAVATNIEAKARAYLASFDTFVELLGQVEAHARTLHRLGDRISDEVAALVEAQHAQVRWLEGVALSALVLASLLGVVMSALVTRSIVRPLRRIQLAAVRLAAGEPEVHVPPTGGEELEALALAFGEVSAHVRRRQDAERRLADAEAFVRAVIDSSGEGLLVADEALRVRLVNRALVDALGVPPDTLIGRPVAELIPPAAREAGLARLRRALEGETASSPDIAREDPVTGETTWYAATSCPLRTAEDRVGGVVISVASVTERKRHEIELEEARRRAEEAAEVKSRFLANMSHEIRTPLNGIIGVGRLLAEDPLPPASADAVGTIVESGEHLLALINDILDLAKLDAERMRLASEAVDVRALVRGCRDIVAEAARAKGLELRLDLDEALPSRVLADPVRLRQILLNLASNAVKFTFDGEVVIAARAAPAASPGATSTLRFEIRDSGIGIDPDHIDRLFDAFEQVDASSTRSAGGTGLGLAICRRLAHLMGGEIDVESQPGLGSTFALTVPLPVVETPSPDRVARTELEVPEGLRVLVAEDNPVNQKVILRMLDRAGVQAELAENGREAVEAAEADTYDIILMDIQMPVLNGLDATRAIRQATGRAPPPRIVALTANALASDREACVAAGMDGFLTKPVQPAELRAALAHRAAERAS
jgi:PAS domain S-box-containing protein